MARKKVDEKIRRYEELDKVDVWDQLEETSDAAEVFARSRARPVTRVGWAAAGVNDAEGESLPPLTSTAKESVQNKPKENPCEQYEEGSQFVYWEKHEGDHWEPPSLYLSRSKTNDGHAKTALRAKGDRGAPKVQKPPKKALGKRKRGQPLNMAPEEKQIFKGLSFYYMRNCDVNVCRRARIRKAQEHGASWVRNWGQGVSYLIIDEDLDYKEVLRVLKQQCIPVGIKVVNQRFPLDCISSGKLLDHNDFLYRVDGAPAPILSGEAAFWTPPPSSPPSGPEKDQESGGLDDVSSTESEMSEHLADPPTANQQEPPSTGSFVNDNSKQLPINGTLKPLVTLKDSPPSRPKDELDEAIKESTRYADLPLDTSSDEEELEAPAGTHQIDQDPTSSDEERAHRARTKRPKLQLVRKQTLDFSKFACMTGHSRQSSVNPPVNPSTCTSSSISPSTNSYTIAILQKMQEYYTNIQDTWRSLSYRRAISTLRAHPQQISTYAEAIALPHIGHRLALKIEEIVNTGHLRRLDATTADPHDKLLRTFTGVYGAGYAQANAWIQAGYTSLTDLLARAKLTDNQRVGILHHADFQARIPRAEAAAHGAFVRSVLKSLDAAEGVELHIMGSYRRGKESCGDVDMLLTHPHMPLPRLREMLLLHLLPALKARGYVQHTLCTCSLTHGAKWHGAATLPDAYLPPPSHPHNTSTPTTTTTSSTTTPIWRRIDFLLVPPSELGASLLYFTGSALFNRSLRLLARKRGMRLNQHGLFGDVLRGPGAGKVSRGVLLEGGCERGIFERLGVQWRGVREREV